MEETVLIKKIFNNKFTLKKPVRIGIRRIGKRLFEGRFLDLPLAITAMGGTRQSISKQLAKGFIAQYQLAVGSGDDISKKIHTACEKYIQSTQPVV
jgi:hypothetical protein